MEIRILQYSFLHNHREERVEIGILLLFTQPERRESGGQPERRESGDWDPGPARSLLPSEGRILRVVRVAVTPPAVVRAVAERRTAASVSHMPGITLSRG